VTLREKPHQVVLPGFWLGESMINVSAYIRDAPHMKLKLIAKGLVHDWNYLIGGNRDTAAFLGWAVFGLGIVAVLGAVTYCAYTIITDIRSKNSDMPR
jgi:hypothetical protein